MARLPKIFLLCLFFLGAKGCNYVKPLGRDFKLGDLFDAPRDSIILGPQLFRRDVLQNATRTSRNKTEWRVDAADSLIDRAASLGVDGDEALSVAAGLLPVRGSGRLLTEKKTAKDQVKVSLTFTASHSTILLNQEVLSDLYFPRIIEAVADASHVVFGLEFGAVVVVVFESNASSTAEVKETRRKMLSAVHLIPKLSATDEVSDILDEETKNLTDEFRCVVYSDVDLATTSMTTTFEQAARLFRDLPRLLNNASNVPTLAVTLGVGFLMPNITGMIEARKVRPSNALHSELTSRVIKTIEDSEEAILSVIEISKSDVAKKHKRIETLTRRFAQNVQSYLVDLKKKIREMMPEMRKRKIPESKLENLMDREDNSIFGRFSLKNWVSFVGKEIAELEKFHVSAKFCGDESEFREALNKGSELTVVFVMRPARLHEYLLGCMEYRLRSDEPLEESLEVCDSGRQKISWGMWRKELKRKLEEMKRFSKIFRSGSMDKDEDRSIQILLRESEIEIEDRNGSVDVQLIRGDVLLRKNFRLPSKLGEPKARRITHHSLTLVWRKPHEGMENVRGFVVDIFKLNDDGFIGGNCNVTMCKVSTLKASATKNRISVNRLQTSRSYYFHLRIDSILGLMSGVWSQKIRTRNCPPGFHLDKRHFCKSCEPGKYSDKPGAARCVTCPLGSFQNKPGATSCFECPPQIGNKNVACPFKENLFNGPAHLRNCYYETAVRNIISYASDSLISIRSEIFNETKTLENRDVKIDLQNTMKILEKKILISVFENVENTFVGKITSHVNILVKKNKTLEEAGSVCSFHGGRTPFSSTPDPLGIDLSGLRATSGWSGRLIWWGASEEIVQGRVGRRCLGIKLTASRDLRKSLVDVDCDRRLWFICSFDED